jgi:hypothetical protein
MPQGRTDSGKKKRMTAYASQERTVSFAGLLGANSGACHGHRFEVSKIDRVCVNDEQTLGGSWITITGGFSLECGIQS